MSPRHAPQPSSEGADKLRRALTRRGIVVPAAAFDPTAARASVSSALADTTTRTAIEFVTSKTISTSAAALAQEVLRVLLISKLRLTAFSLLLLVAGVAGMGLLARVLAANDDSKLVRADRRLPVVVKANDADQKPAPGRMFVVGRVLDPDGKPVEGAAVDLLTMPRKFRVGASATDAYYTNYTMLGQGETDGDGRYRLETPRTSWMEHRDLIAIGRASGFGLGWADLNPDASEPSADVRLRPEQVIRLKLLDVNGIPAAGVEVRVWRIGLPLNDRGEAIGVRLLESQPAGNRAWPRPATTDNQGKLVLSGIGRGLSVNLTVSDNRFAQQYLDLQADSLGASKEIIRACSQPRSSRAASWPPTLYCRFRARPFRSRAESGP